MAVRNAKSKNRTYRDINIGIVIFAFILLYLVIKIVIYYSKDEISIYEVPAGKVYTKQTFKGYIFREEEVVYTTTAGYINHYFLEGDRVQKGGAVYSIGSNKDIYSYLQDQNAEIRLSDEALGQLKKTINTLYRECDSQDDYKRLQDKISTVYSRQLDKEVLENLNQIIKDNGTITGFKVVKAKQAGFVSYYVDDYSTLKLEDINKSYFSKDYESKYVYTSEMTTIDSPAYKMVTSPYWTIAILIDEKMYLRLRNLKKADIIINDEDRLTVDIDPQIKNSEYYCYINMDKYVMRYSAYRFLDIIFDIDDVEGLKIPSSSICYREYYRIPDSYFTRDKEGNWTIKVENYNQDTGTVQNDTTIVEVFYSQDEFKYIDASQIADNKYIFDKDLSNKSSLSAFKMLVEGVYNVNNGYAIFRRIEKVDENDGYVIIKTGTVGGLEIYDHISVNGKEVTEGMVIY